MKCIKTEYCAIMRWNERTHILQYTYWMNVCSVINITIIEYFIIIIINIILMKYLIKIF